MTGGLLELVARGDQDRHLTGTPQMSLFKKIYKKYTNFSLESRKVYFKEKLNFGTKINCVIPKNGDLINNIILQLELEDLSNEIDIGYTNSIGHSIIEKIDIYIGDTLIDSHTGEWMNIWSDLTIDENKKLAFNNMIGKNPFGSHNSNSIKNGKFLIPLYFWFTQENGLSLPLVALQYHDVSVSLKLRPFRELWISDTNQSPSKEYSIKNLNLLVDYIYLDSQERRYFAQSKHEYLIKQVQINKNNISINNSNINIKLNFNHPVLELVWTTKILDNTHKNDWFNFSNSINGPYLDPIENSQLYLNGVERTIEMDNLYLRLYQPYKRHTNVPDSFIYLYSFSLDPENYQPSGSCNFSRFDNSQLNIKFSDNLPECNITVYALNYNVLRIMCGMGGIAYFN